MLCINVWWLCVCVSYLSYQINSVINYIYQTLLSKATYIQSIHFCQYMCSLGIEPTTFTLLTQYSTTEPILYSELISLHLYSFSAVQHYIPVKYIHFLCNVFIFTFLIVLFRARSLPLISARIILTSCDLLYIYIYIYIYIINSFYVHFFILLS